MDAGRDKRAAHVLIACEFSGIVRDEFRKLGHDAWSCDLLTCESDPTYHYQIDIFSPTILSQEWDMIIAFPPCTHLAVSGARWWKNKIQEQKDAIQFVQDIMNMDSPRIAIENPIGIISTKIRKPDQIIQPWWFGEGETKATCLWLKNLPLLTATNVVSGRTPRVHYESPGPNRWKNRSRTYKGIATAMANQWGSVL